MLQWACSAFASPDDVTSAPGGCPFDPAVDDIQGYIDAASDIMFQLTDGRVHGVCTVTVFPLTNRNCFQPWDDDLRGSWWEGGPTGASIVHRRHRLPGLADQFGGHLPVRLAGPNVTVIDVTIDGVTLAPTDYILVNGVYLIRKVGGWPTSNDITQPSGVGTWSITYSYGAVDLITRDGCVQLAIDLAKTSGIGASTGFGAGVTNVNLQGVQLTVEDLVQQYATGSQNVAALDRFLGIYAGKGRETAGVYSPELDMWELQQVTFLS